jgi:rhomboid family GlyGly-CTERM serine protease
LASALPAAHALAYTALGIEKGQWWRLWTGHLVHYGSAHLWGDLLAFAVWAALVESESRRVLLATLLCGAPLLSCAFWLACPQLGEYRGLSSLDAALVIELIVLRGFAPRASAAGRGLGPWLTRALGSRALRAVGWLSLGLFALKTAYEYAAGHALLAPDLGQGVRLLPSAHAFGGLLGLAVCIVVQRLTPSASPVSRTLRH